MGELIKPYHDKTIIIKTIKFYSMPFAESMISTLKSNKRIMLDKSKRFRKTLGGYDKNRKMEFNLPKATPKQLREIRQKLKKENQLLWLKVIGLSVIICIGIVWMLFLS